MRCLMCGGPLPASVVVPICSLACTVEHDQLAKRCQRCRRRAPIPGRRHCYLCTAARLVGDEYDEDPVTAVRRKAREAYAVESRKAREAYARRLNVATTSPHGRRPRRRQKEVPTTA